MEIKTLKDCKVGDEVYIVNDDQRNTAYKATIKAIKSKYIYINHSSKYNVETGRGHEKNRCWNETAYYSEDDYFHIKRNEAVKIRIINILHKKIDSMNLDSLQSTLNHVITLENNE